MVVTVVLCETDVLVVTKVVLSPLARVEVMLPVLNDVTSIVVVTSIEALAAGALEEMLSCRLDGNFEWSYPVSTFSPCLSQSQSVPHPTV